MSETNQPISPSEAAAALGRLGGKIGGKVKTPKKAKASRKNMAKARERLAEIIAAGKKAVENEQ